MNKIKFEDLPSTKTPINAENLNNVQTNTEKAISNIENDLYYKSGDKFSCSVNHGYTCAGNISGNKKSLFFSMHTPKSLKNIKSFKANKFIINLRLDGAYIGGGSGYDYATDTENYNIDFYKVNEHTILVLMTSVEDWCSTNNVSLTVDFAEFEIELS